MSKASTGPGPCKKFWPRACHEIFLREKAVLEMKCIIPILNSGIELDEKITEVSSF